MTSFHLLGPIYLGEGTNAFLGLEISRNYQIEPVVVVWFPGDPNDSALEYIKQEAQAATALQHANILKLHGLYELNGRLARVVDYVDGEPLQRFLETAKSLPIPIAARILCDAAEGVHYAHTATTPPWVHGALRPETLMLSFSGMVRVSGYGAQVFAPPKPEDPHFKGRRKHIAPEQIENENDTASPQTDVYLLGICLYECITGMVPFIAETHFDEAVLTRPLPPMPPETPSALEAVIAKACAKKPSERYASAWEFRQAVISAVGVLPSHEALAETLNMWIPPTEKSRHYRQQLIDEGLNQILAQHQPSFKPKTHPEDLTLPPVSAEYLPGQQMPAESPLGELEVSPDAMTLPPFKMGPPENTPRSENMPRAAAPIFVSQKPSAFSSPPYAYNDEDFGSKTSTSAVTWAVGGFLAASALAVIAYFTFLPSAPLPPPPPPVTTVAPLPKLPPEALLPPPTPPPQTAAKTKTPASPSAKTKGTAAPAASVTPARVNIKADMPLDISFKGKHLGRTPTQVSLPPGNVALLLSNKSTGIRTQRTLELRPGQTVDLYVQLGKGMLHVNAPAGARILVNGVLRGTAPMREIELWEGNHRLRVEYGDSPPLTKNFSLAPGGYMNYDVTSN